MAWIDESEGSTGPAFDDYWWISETTHSDGINISTDSSQGTSVNSQGSGGASFALVTNQVNELVGKIGVVIEPYNPEKSSQLIQEFT